MEQRKEPAPEQEDDSSSEEYEEETTYVVLDLGSDFTKEMIEAAATVHDGVSLIGLDTPTPFLRVGNLIYKGTLDQTVGTDLIFSASAQDESRPKRPIEGPLPLSTDLNRPDIEMNFLGHTTRKLKMTRIMLDPKESTKEAGGQS